MTFKRKNVDLSKNYKVDKSFDKSKDSYIYVLTDDDNKQILSSSSLAFVSSFCDRLTASGHYVTYTKPCLDDLKGVLPFA